MTAAAAPVHLRVDCVVIGAGPAGSAMASRLAELGVSVCLLDRQTSAETRGESLPAGIVPLLRQLGVDEASLGLQPRALTGMILLWGQEQPVVADAADKPTFVVDRARFDEGLLAHAVRSGAHIVRPARIIATERLEDGGWTVRAVAEDREIVLTARIMAIAAGRRGGLGGRRRRHGPATLALCATLAGQTPAIGESRIEAGADGWCWAAPFDGLTAVAMVLDPADANLAAGAEICLRQRLQSSRLLRDLTRLPLLGSIRACDASRSGSAVVVADGTIQVGEACFASDPLSSQGVVRAIVSGLQGAIAVNTLLRRPDDTAAVERFCAARQAEALEQDAAVASEYYRGQAKLTPTPFWLARRRPETGFPQRDRDRLDAALPLAFDPEAVMAREAVVDRELIAWRPALSHPGLARPIAFVRNVPVTTLLPALATARPAADILRTWLRHLDEGDACSLLEMFLQRGILVAAAEALG